MDNVKIKNKAIDKAPKNKTEKKPKRKVLIVVKEYAGIEKGKIIKSANDKNTKYMTEKGYWAWK